MPYGLPLYQRSPYAYTVREEMQDKIKELEQEIARMQKTIQELKEQVPIRVLETDSEGLFIGSYKGSGMSENRLILKAEHMDECLAIHLSDGMIETADIDFANTEYNPKRLTSTQFEALDRVVGRFLNGTIM